MSDREPQEPATAAGRTFLDALNTMDRLAPGIYQTPVDWAHGIRAIEAEAARAAERDSTPGATQIALDRLIDRDSPDYVGDEAVPMVLAVAAEARAPAPDSGREAREALRIYGRHLKGCCVTVSPVPANCCDCGFLRALAADPRPEGTDPE